MLQMEPRGRQIPPANCRHLPSSPPLFGVVASYFIMHDTLTPVFGAAALLVIAGLYLVNRPGPVVYAKAVANPKNLSA